MVVLVQPTTVVRRVVTAVVAVVVFEVVGLGTYLVVARPGTLSTLTSSETTAIEKGLAVTGSPLLLVLAVGLAGVAIAYAARSKTPGAATTGDETGVADDGEFSFGDGGE